MADQECPKCPPEGLPAWMGTFADLMSLLMCFFVLLLSFSEMDVLKFKQIAGSMKNAFGVQTNLEVKDIPKGTSVIAQEFRPGKPDPTPIEVIMQQTIEMTKAKLDFKEGDSNNSGGQTKIQAPKQDAPDESESDNINEPLDSTDLESQEQQQEEEQQDEAMDEPVENLIQAPGVSADHGLASKVAKDLREEINDGAIEIESLGQQLIIRIREKGAFPSGSAFLQPRFRPVISKVGKVLVDVPGVITISGHTDSEPVHSELYRSNWDLSAQRAVSVAHEMLKVKGMKGKELVVAGYANTKPLTKGKSIAERRRNRRVEIMVMQGEAKESDPIGLPAN
ncbi:flagellar motor protein MotB [Psychromonas sp. MME2]|uniref:flagellar motor protein MotB n=1 Tax=unclassified Psychromonas TaxID=2614957 RepID=UPI00339C3883